MKILFEMPSTKCEMFDFMGSEISHFQDFMQSPSISRVILKQFSAQQRKANTWCEALSLIILEFLEFGAFSFPGSPTSGYTSRGVFPSGDPDSIENQRK